MGRIDLKVCKDYMGRTDLKDLIGLNGKMYYKH